MKKEDFEDFKFDSFSIDLFDDDSLDEMFLNPFENISTTSSTQRTESGYCTTTPSTPETQATTSSGVHRDSAEIR